MRRDRNTKYAGLYAQAAALGFDCENVVWQRWRWRLTAYRSNGISVKVAATYGKESYELFEKLAVDTLRKFALTGNQPTRW